MGIKIQITLALVSFVSTGLGNPQFSGGFDSEGDLDFVHHVFSGNFGGDRFGDSSRQDGFLKFLLRLYDLSKAIDGDNRDDCENYDHPINFGPHPAMIPPHLSQWRGQIPVPRNPFPFPNTNPGAHEDPALIPHGLDQGDYLPVQDERMQPYPIHPTFSVLVSHDPLPFSNTNLGASVDPASVPQWSDQGSFSGQSPTEDTVIQQYPIVPIFSVPISHDQFPFSNTNPGAQVDPASVPQWSDQEAFSGHFPSHETVVQPNEYPIDPIVSVPVIDGQSIPDGSNGAQLPNEAVLTEPDQSPSVQPVEAGIPIAETLSNPIEAQASDPEPKLGPVNFEEPGHFEQP